MQQAPQAPSILFLGFLGRGIWHAVVLSCTRTDDELQMPIHTTPPPPSAHGAGPSGPGERYVSVRLHECPVQF